MNISFYNVGMVVLAAESKLDQVLGGATRVFAHVGFKRAQMADIATEAGVALGTLYRYSRSKTALFYLAVQRGFGVDGESLRQQLDREPPTRREVVEFVLRSLATGRLLPTLAARLSAPEAPSQEQIRAVLVEIVGELYDTVDRHHLGIRILDRSVHEWPELGQCFVDEVRGPAVRQLAEFIERCAEQGLLPRPADAAAAARLVVEICAALAMHRHFTSGGAYASAAVARDMAIHFAVSGLVAATSMPARRPGASSEGRNDP